MVNTKQYLAALQQTLNEVYQLKVEDRLFVYGTIKALLDELKSENEEKFNNNAYTSEKLTEFQEHIKCLIGLEGPTGHDEQQQYVWCLKALDALKSEFCFNTKERMNNEK